MPVRNFKTVFYDIEYIDNFSNTSNDFSNDPRNLQVSEIQLGESVISILNTHGIWQLDKKKTDTDRTLKMTQTIINNVNLKKPTIVCGDLNLVPNTESIAQLDKVVTNLVTKNGITNTRNQFKGVQEVVDYVFVSNLIKVNGFKMIETTASDHNALVLDFDIQK